MSAEGQILEAPPATGGPLALYQQFEGQLQDRAQAIAMMLPRHVSRDRFLSVALAAVKQNPMLLNCNLRSLMGAITKAAQDGLLPDGREGVISSYNTNVAKKSESAKYVEMAQWNPMVYGLRKRARELDNILIDAQVVYENDHFDWDQGDNPHIIHKAPQLGQPRGAILGAYAIFKREDGTILHREVMCTAEIESVREQSKAKNSLMWTKFQTEGYRKTVIRRGIKTVPVSESLEQVVRRDDDLFDFGGNKVQDVVTAPPSPPPAPPSPPPAPKAVTHAPAEVLDIPATPESIPAEVDAELDRAALRQMNGEAPDTTERDELAEYIGDMCQEADRAPDLATLDSLDDQVCAEIESAHREALRPTWNEAYLRNKDRLKPKGKK